MEKYNKIIKIGEGGFSTVFKYRNNVTKQIVAIKKIEFEVLDEGVPTSVIREVSLLNELDHTIIIRLLDVVNVEENLHLVFECMDYDLENFIIEKPEIAKDPLILKSFLLQILRGVAYCHSHKILHRDLKPQNLLVDVKRKIVKLADFGLARAIGIPLRTYTAQVATLGYTAPELLLGMNYSTALDVWSFGCIFAEMVTRKPLFTGTIGPAILKKICSMFGVPKEETWPGVTKAQDYSETSMFPTGITKSLAEVVPGLEPDGFDLLCCGDFGRAQQKSSVEELKWKSSAEELSRRAQQKSSAEELSGRARRKSSVEELSRRARRKSSVEELKWKSSAEELSGRAQQKSSAEELSGRARRKSSAEELSRRARRKSSVEELKWKSSAEELSGRAQQKSSVEELKWKSSAEDLPK